MDGERVHQERITEATEHQGSHALLGRIRFYNLCRGQFRNIHGNHDTLVPFDLEIHSQEFFFRMHLWRLYVKTSFVVSKAWG